MIGPVRSIPFGDGVSADLYLLRFDKSGRLLSPQTARLAVAAARKATDLFLFSHGWNNVYADALDAYVRFAEGFISQRRRLGLPVPDGYRPVLIGVIWPATWFVPDRDEGPVIAGGGTDGEQIERMLAEITSDMPAESATEFAELIDGAEWLDTTQAERAADLMRAALWNDEDAESRSEPPDTAAVLSAWAALTDLDQPFVEDEEEVGTIGGGPTARGRGAPSAERSGTDAQGDPASAGRARFSPRDALRLGSVWTMKARSGKVGVRGVGPLLAEILARGSEVRVHLVGHSFGARLLLSALASQQLERKARSMLLLQPAVNRWCFAAQVIGKDQPGGYRIVLERVEQPVLATRSAHDFPLHKVFHLAVRGGSLGEIDLAAIGDVDRYGALGGYQPQREDEFRRDVVRDPDGDDPDYDLSAAGTVISLDGSREVDGKRVIGGHADINSKYTWWALHCLAVPPASPARDAADVP